ncbi:MAG: hypothetical protein HOC79_05340 [Euryarchaeota archaeon]|nr:hypothetical protein [Euryarchaeota archaeon]
MRLTVSTRPLEDNEAIHIYGSDEKGWSVCLTRDGLFGSHQIWPHIMSNTKHTIEECEDFIRDRHNYSSTIGYRCSCCIRIE